MAWFEENKHKGCKVKDSHFHEKKEHDLMEKAKHELRHGNCDKYFELKTKAEKQHEKAEKKRNKERHGHGGHCDPVYPWTPPTVHPDHPWTPPSAPQPWAPPHGGSYPDGQQYPGVRPNYVPGTCPPPAGQYPPAGSTGYPPRYPPTGSSGYPPAGSSGYPPAGSSGYPPAGQYYPPGTYPY